MLKLPVPRPGCGSLSLHGALVAGLLAVGCTTTNTKPPSSHSVRPSVADDAEGCPMAADAAPASYRKNEGELGPADWWPEQLDLRVLHQNSARANPLPADFDYRAAFGALDLDAVRADLESLMKDSQSWWPADYGHYGPLFIRMAWHSAGTYRVSDGRGGASDGTQRFPPLNSWPDNANLDKARRLLWPIKQKYGASISWADLMVLAGTVALESMGLETVGFGGGREDVWEPQQDVDWGPERAWLADQRHGVGHELENPLAAVQMGLIYVNPEGPGGEPDPLAAAHDIRVTFGRMGMNDEETVALIAGGHTLGKAHGAADPSRHVGPEPEAAPMEQQGLGWKNSFGTGHGADTITSGLEGAWTATPVQWSNGYFRNLFRYEWELVRSPAGAWQWSPGDAPATVPDAHDPSKTHRPIMFTTDMALRMDPGFREISQRFHDDPDSFERAFARAWFKLTHRDMGPVTRLVGNAVPPAELWQDPLPPVDHPLVDGADVRALKAEVADSGLAPSALVHLAWASAATYRDSDKRGGANGARILLLPQRDWAVNQGLDLDRTMDALDDIRERFASSRTDGKRISRADMIVLAGAAGIEMAARAAGRGIVVPFVPGRTDATQEMTDVQSFAHLEPAADGFRGYMGELRNRRAEEWLLDHAQQLSLSAPEMTVLVGGLRAMGVRHDGGSTGVLTEEPGTLTADFFVNLLDMGTVWERSAEDPDLFVGRSRADGEPRWTATAFELVFGSHSQLRALAEHYASADAHFVDDFVSAWTKVMRLDRFDLAAAPRN